MPTAQVLHVFLERMSFHIVHQPTRRASFRLYPMAFHPPPLRGRFINSDTSTRDEYFELQSLSPKFFGLKYKSQTKQALNHSSALRPHHDASDLPD
jgi:hypothetical protein